MAVDLEGRSEVVVRVPPFPFCIDWLPDGRLLIVSGSDRLLLRQQPDESLVSLADLAGLCDPPWNEIVVAGSGNVYLNSIGFDMMAGEDPSPGIIAVVTPDGSARQVADDVAFPNGMAVTPDGTTLILAESHASRLTAFDIEGDGGLSNRRVWADLDAAAPDGICLDDEGAVWYADVPHKRCVRIREGGKVLQTVDLDRGCFSCALGGADGRTLFMTAAQWHGPENAADGTRTGQVPAMRAPSPGAHRP